MVDVVVRGDCVDCRCRFYEERRASSSASSGAAVCLCGHSVVQHPVISAHSRNTITGSLQLIYGSINPHNPINTFENNESTLLSAPDANVTIDVLQAEETEAPVAAQQSSGESVAVDIQQSTVDGATGIRRSRIRKKALFGNIIVLLHNEFTVPQAKSALYKDMQSRGQIADARITLYAGKCLQSQLREHLLFLEKLHLLNPHNNVVLYDFVRKATGSRIDPFATPPFNNLNYPLSLHELMAACNKGNPASPLIIIKLRPPLSITNDMFSDNFNGINDDALSEIIDYNDYDLSDIVK